MRLLQAPFVLLLAPALLLAESVTTPLGLKVTDESVYNEVGYNQGAPVARLRVENPTGNARRLSVTFAPLYSGHRSERISSSVEIPAGASSVLELPGHQRTSGSNEFEAMLRDGGPKPVELRLPAFDNNHYGESYSVYLSQSLSPEALTTVLESVSTNLVDRPAYASREKGNVRAVRTTEFPSPWPGDWRAYSVFAAVFIAAPDWSAVPAAGKAALRDYVSAGGRVVFLGAESVPADFAPFAPLAEPSGSVPARLSSGLGAVVAVPQAAPAEFSDETVLSLVREMFASRDFLGFFRRFDNAAWHLVYGLDPSSIVHIVRTGGFLITLLLFSVLAGPVVHRRLVRKNRRIHILWILPAISAVFCLAIVVTFLLSEGVRPTVNRVASTFLDQRLGRAVTLGAATIYAPTSLGRGFDFPRDAMVCSPTRQDAGHIDVGPTLHYAGDWIAPRVTTAFGLRRVVASSLRLDVSFDPDGTPVVVNALGAPVSSLELWDSDGRPFHAGAVAPGASVRLSPGMARPAPAADTSASEPSAPEPPAIRLARLLAFGGDCDEKSGGPEVVELDGDGGASVSPVRPAAPRHDPDFRSLYIARLDGDCPFLDDPLAGRPARREASSTVFGKF